MGTTPQPRRYVRDAFRIAGIYLVVSAIWILASDTLAARLAADSETWLRLSQYKGLAFVAVTAVLLFVMVLRSVKNAEHSRSLLKESELRFAAFMQHLPVGAFLKDRESRYVYTNEFWRTRFSPSRAPLGATAAELFSSENAATFDAYHARTLAGETSEQIITLPQGSAMRTWLITRFPVPLADSGEILVGGFALDITERQELEGQLRQASKLEAVGRLAGGVAHDFNNLLTVINGYAELLQMNPANAAGPAREIGAAGQRAAQLTRQLLAFSRRQILTPEPVRLDQVVNGMRDMLQRLIGENVLLEISACDGVSAVRVDPNQAEQVIMNLVVNARDAMPRGGVIHIRTCEEPAPRPGRFVRLSVSDTGEGMDEATRARIFEPFFTTKAQGKGTGLGLSTVYGIVEQSGGTIEVASEPGRGSTFHVYLPVYEAEA